MIASLFQSPYFALFLIVTLGFILGKIEIKGISLDVSAVIFIALLFGHFGVVIPSALSDFGMVLFIFTIGIQAGPGFADSFRSKGRNLVFIALIVIASATIVAIATKLIFGFTVAQTVGLLTGALTSTPGLATAKELAGDSTAVAYGVAYPFGVIGVILFVKLLPMILKMSVSKVEEENEASLQDRFPQIHSAIYCVTNTNIIGKSLADLKVRSVTGAVVSRISHHGEIQIPTPSTILEEGDLIKGVGISEALNKMEMFIGEKLKDDSDLPLAKGLERSTALVTNRHMVNTSLATINIQQNFGATITRVHRSGIDITPTPELSLKFGDKLTFLAPEENIDELLKMFGNDKKSLSDTDFMPISLGIVLGVLFGKLSLSFGNGLTFSFGLTGGILLIALVLSSIGKTGPIIWNMSSASNSLLRQLGLLMFLAGVGTSAGTTVVETFIENGAAMFVAGVIITLVPMILAALAGKYLFKLNILDMMGVITGSMTSTPGLAAADSMTSSSAPSIAYATVYPVAMVFLIICVQIITIIF